MAAPRLKTNRTLGLALVAALLAATGTTAKTILRVISVDNADLLLEFDFQNGPDSVVLWSAENTVLDAVGYGAFSEIQFFAGEGSSAPDARAGSSVARFFADLDTDDNAQDFGVLYAPTPGTAEFLPIPEPGTGLLVGSALGVLAPMRRETK